jgi:hypothetical protein
MIKCVNDGTGTKCRQTHCDKDFNYINGNEGRISGAINFVCWPETMGPWIYSDLTCPVAERKNFSVQLSWVINRGASIWSANKISKHKIENMTVKEIKKRHMPLAQLKIMFFFFLTQGHYSHQVSCTELKSKPVLLLQNVKKVLWPFITNTRHVAQSLQLASWQYPCTWHTYCLGDFGQKVCNKIGISTVLARFGP